MATKRVYQAVDAAPVVLYVKQDADSETVYPLLDTAFGASSDKQILIDDVTTTGMTYIGYADIGAATSAASWKIKRVDESGTPNTTVIKYATAGASTCIYDNRASLTYT